MTVSSVPASAPPPTTDRSAGVLLEIARRPPRRHAAEMGPGAGACGLSGLHDLHESQFPQALGRTEAMASAGRGLAGDADRGDAHHRPLVLADAGPRFAAAVSRCLAAWVLGFPVELCLGGSRRRGFVQSRFRGPRVSWPPDRSGRHGDSRSADRAICCLRAGDHRHFGDWRVALRFGCEDPSPFSGHSGLHVRRDDRRWFDAVARLHRRGLCSDCWGEFPRSVRFASGWSRHCSSIAASLA